MHNLHGHLNFVQSLGLYLHACLCELSRMCSVVQVVSRTEEQKQQQEETSGGGGGGGAGHGPPRYQGTEKCVVVEKEETAAAAAAAPVTMVAEMEGELIKTRSARQAFAYFMLVAFEAGSPVRGLMLLLWWPMIWAVSCGVSEWAAMRMMVWVATAGLRESEVAGVGRAVLPRFFLQDLHPRAAAAAAASASASASLVLLTAFPRLLVQPFLHDYLGAHILLLATELSTFRGFCTGFLVAPSAAAATAARHAVKRSFPSSSTLVPALRLASSSSTSATFLSLSKERLLETSATEKQKQKAEEGSTGHNNLRRPLIFHDGRLVMRPTPLVSLFIYLWLPVGFALAIVRLIVWCLLPAEVSVPLSALLGVRLRVKGSPPLAAAKSGGGDREDGSLLRRGMLYVCTHRTLLDPIFLSVALRRPVTAVTYSLSRLSELLSPITTVRLSRRRDADADTIASLLRQGDLIICPEGTTCREPYLLRFSPLFAEITHDIVPVGISVHMSVFHGTTARGLKAMDPFFFLMNPRPSCSITILDPLPLEETCASGRSSVEVANRIQKRMGEVMGYQCTNLTRRDKYRVLAGNDGIVPMAAAAVPTAPPPPPPPPKSTTTSVPITPRPAATWAASLFRSLSRSIGPRPLPRDE